MAIHWGNEDDPRTYKEIVINPLMAFALVAVISCALAILVFWLVVQ
jgi:hypothetical protein